jgi:chemotaxis protein MotB
VSRKKHAPHAGNHERWLVSYADFMTLLFAFFTSMYAISTVDAQKAGKMVFSTRAAFNLDFFPSDKPVLGGSSGSSDSDSNKKGKKAAAPPFERPFAVRTREKTPDKVKHKTEPIRAVADDLQKYIDQRGLTGKLRVRIDRRGLVVSMAAAALFDSGSADIRRDSLPMLDTVATKLLATGYPLMVEGHTDDRPIRSASFRSNWELSTARATGVVVYLVEEFAYPAELLSAAGYAAYHPVESNETPEGRTANRRVDLVVLSPTTPDDLGKLQPPSRLPAASPEPGAEPATEPTASPP